MRCTRLITRAPSAQQHPPTAAPRPGRRRYESGAQAQAFQFLLDDLTARGLIAWIREPTAIHITVAREADLLVPLMLEHEGEGDE